MSLEKIIRPFQDGDVFSPRVILPSQTDPAGTMSTDICDLTVTGKNDGTYDTNPYPAYNGFTSDLDHIEDKSKREIETVRIEQPDNPDNYIMVDRLKKASFVNTKTGENFNLQFADWDKDRK